MKKTIFVFFWFIFLLKFGYSQKFENLALTPPMGWNSWNKFGVYSDAGTHTCQGRPGSRGYEYQDARTYAFCPLNGRK